MDAREACQAFIAVLLYIKIELGRSIGTEFNESY